MKVLVVNNMAPFVWGGAEELARNLCVNLRTEGHHAEVLRIPFRWEPAIGIGAQMSLVRALEVSNADRVVALKFPAYLIRHSAKTLWLLHQYRQAYDLWDAGQTNLPGGERGMAIRELIRTADASAFDEASNIFVNSHVTRDRLLRFNRVESEILLPPVNDPELFTGGDFGGYVFAGGRINEMKRQHLLVEAVGLASQSLRLVIAGPPDTPADAERIERLVEEQGLGDRVTLDFGFLSREVYAGYLNGATAVAYLPYDEDSLGYVAMEAATARKPIITTTDSGGLLALVEDRVTGWVVEPQPHALADALMEVGRPGPHKQALGKAAHQRWIDFGVSWPATIETLLR